MKLTERQKKLIMGLIMQEINRYGSVDTININNILDGYKNELRELNYIISESLED